MPTRRLPVRDLPRPTHYDCQVLIADRQRFYQDEFFGRWLPLGDLTEDMVMEEANELLKLSGSRFHMGVLIVLSDGFHGLLPQHGVSITEALEARDLIREHPEAVHHYLVMTPEEDRSLRDFRSVYQGHHDSVYRWVEGILPEGANADGWADDMLTRGALSYAPTRDGVEVFMNTEEVGGFAFAVA